MGPGPNDAAPLHPWAASTNYIVEWFGSHPSRTSAAARRETLLLSREPRNLHQIDLFNGFPSLTIPWAIAIPDLETL